jgi:sulfatase modifying factor 1
MRFTLGSDITPPAITDGLMPRRGVGNQADESAVFDFTVDEHGVVKNLQPMHGSKSECDILGAYLANWKFNPAVRGGQPMEVRGRVLFIKGSGDETSNRAITPPGQSQDSESARRQPPAPATNTPAAAAASTRKNPKDGEVYVWIPPGVFAMGCSDGDAECRADEKGTHSEKIETGFWMGQTEVTQAAYQRVMHANPSVTQGDQLPVDNLPWTKALEYCLAVDGHLPSGAEWEYAARGRTSVARYGDLDAIAWHSGNSGQAIHPVGTKEANGFGLYDMLGNVWEWVEDSYDGGSPTARILRGGSALSDSQNARASSRAVVESSLSSAGKGFRCAADWPAPQPLQFRPPTPAPPGTTWEGTHPGGTKPILLRKVDPDYSAKARQAKIEGVVVLSIDIDVTGHPVNPRVVHSLGYGLDEKAIEAVKKWKFEPARQDGKPIQLTVTVEVNFRLL